MPQKRDSGFFAPEERCAYDALTFVAPSQLPSPGYQQVDRIPLDRVTDVRPDGTRMVSPTKLEKYMDELRKRLGP